MPAIEADSDVVEVHGFDELNETIGSGEFVRNIFDQYSDSERLGEGAQELDGGHCGLEFLFVKGVVGIADMLHQEAEGDMLGDFESTLDLVHGIDTTGAVGGGDVDRRAARTSPFIVGIQRRMY